MFAEVVDDENVRMVERRGRPGLAVKASEPIGIVRQLYRQKFERHLPIQLTVPREVDLAHAARPEARYHEIRPDRCTDQLVRRAHGRVDQAVRRCFQKRPGAIVRGQQLLDFPTHSRIVFARPRDVRGALGCVKRDRGVEHRFDADPLFGRQAHAPPMCV
jgi:hypothetical protein